MRWEDAAPREVLARIVSYVRPHRGLVAAAFLTAVGSQGLALTVPVLVGLAIDAVVGPGQVAWGDLAWLMGCLACVVAAVALLQWLQGYTTSRLTYDTVRDLRDAAYGKFRRLPVSYIDDHPHGDIMSRVVNDADAVGDGLLQGVQQLFCGVVAVVGTLAFMFWISPAIAVVVVVVTPVSVLVAAFIAKVGHTSFAAQQEIQGDLGGYVEEHVSNQRLLWAFGRAGEAEKGFAALNDRLYTVGERAQFAGSLTNPGTRFANNVVYAVVAAIGCWACLTGFPGPLSIGGVQSFLSYTTQYTKPFNDISGVMTQLQTAFASARRLFALIDAPEMEPDPADALVLPEEPAGEMGFSDVSFGYEPGRPLLEGLTWHADPGERVAVVGPTGCGKTTLINLLLRFYDADSGTIRVDGRDTRALTRASLRRAFGMVLQDTWLFEGTVADNIAYGRPDATREEVWAAAERAFAADFIERMPEGYDTVVGEGGAGLSQGQRQLLCIARVMLVDPPILLLDEATSSIDTRTEALVQEAFDAMMAGRTSLVVAHRLSTVRSADQILVMGRGTIVERGTHEELLALGGEYAKLYRSQFEG
ncbi:ABC transporter ATP-binding protein [Coriobacteriaceae bacterium]|uniref:Fatty acid ABC transporter ATP-binding/permease protein n=1 Tax=Granulimonas faecalis TaxID=2894155 RepID=A0AAV5B275_9ACTN|nr:ABC transporter ATP-binding protein [Granulimonas faecalis]MBF0598755.1 ABC transporter ATP-binding protein [Atopobiaceae bacterium FL090493]TGY60139.1 ABC transporter ATP-binding protein [Coriobacteriaceae bacterium]GJM55232.1 sugar ABC transporter ATP-binding protein [Granulimonas faecalis]